LLNVLISEANGSERLGGVILMKEVAQQLPNLALLWVDQGYQGEKFETAIKQVSGASVEVIKRQGKEFEILPRRWVVERTFAWLVKNRRLVVDYEQLTSTSEAMIYAAMIRLMLRRLVESAQTS
jgi:putative transposase